MLAAGPGAGSAAFSAGSSRPAWIASREVQEQDIAGVLEETTFWVQAGEQRFLVVSRPPSGEAARGTLLFLVDESAAPDGHTRSAGLRIGLARHGWHTFFARLDATAPIADVSSGSEPASTSADEADASRLAQLQALLGCARDNGSGDRVVVVVEGGAGHLVLPLASRLQSDGFIILNLPLLTTSARQSRHALAAMQGPSLLVQEFPLGWAQDQELGSGVELRRLPPGHGGRDDDRVLRRLRGWLQRQAAG